MVVSMVGVGGISVLRSGTGGFSSSELGLLPYTEKQTSDKFLDQARYEP